MVPAREGMGISAQRDGRITVAHTMGDGHHVYIIRQQDGGVGVAQIVEGDALEAVGIVKGDRMNFKITTEFDLTLAECLLKGNAGSGNG